MSKGERRGWDRGGLLPHTERENHDLPEVGFAEQPLEAVIQQRTIKDQKQVMGVPKRLELLRNHRASHAITHKAVIIRPFQNERGRAEIGWWVTVVR
jgi:hypothetical protein